MPLIHAGGARFDVAAIVFDKDGTLIDLDAAWAPRGRAWVLSLERRAGVPGLGAVLANVIGLDLEAGTVVPGGLLAAAPLDDAIRSMRQAMAAAGVEMSADGVRAGLDVGGGSIVALGDPIPTFESLTANGVRIAVLTSDDHGAAADDLESIGVLRYVSELCGADDGFPPKPDSGGFLSIASALGLDPGRMLMVGDSMADLATARNARAGGAVLVAGSNISDETRHSADAVVPNVDAITVEGSVD